jgi:hypothetical protein
MAMSSEAVKARPLVSARRSHAASTSGDGGNRKGDGGF